jgi:hypothetical protein
LGRELINPKTAIVNIVPVGSLSPEQIAANATVAESAAPAELDASVPVADDLPTEIAGSAPVLDLLQLETVETPQLVVTIDDPVAPTHAVDEIEMETIPAMTATSDVSEESSENRRRKRRSSAVVD